MTTRNCIKVLNLYEHKKIISRPTNQWDLQKQCNLNKPKQNLTNKCKCRLSTLFINKIN